MVNKNNRKQFTKLIKQLFKRDSSHHTIVLSGENHNPIIILRLIDGETLKKLMAICSAYHSKMGILCWDTIQLNMEKPNPDLDYLVITT